MTDDQPLIVLPTLDEIAHLRVAKTGDMYRCPDGRVVLNPSPDRRGLKGARGSTFLRRNARKDVVAGLLEKQWLSEGPTRFLVTPAGDAVIAADDSRKQLHAELYRERFGAAE